MGAIINMFGLGVLVPTFPEVRVVPVVLVLPGCVLKRTSMGIEGWKS